ncbi:TIGR01458 family HAD-type hydrolase [Cellvibrio sp. KY-GH-1]|uniref:TIGR01458 family HAD-type hydrolase n=1 Tax=Cellvibrio sp. KY-GH-1 TaxID=2303332 RepID=UPI001243D692|nr:TIGR01458 family HAD-type hydrolase [Cellvibrio sp. KY-GH-1]QEY18435.1 TIGR01458 family HAD-type hydrolase [Cellvibrio sp. KY-GH-1]
MKRIPELIMLDLDGTLYVGKQPIPGAISALQLLRKRGIQLRFLTNTTTKSLDELIAQLRVMGFTLDDEELISAPVGAKLELLSIQQNLRRPLRIWPVVADGIKQDFSEFFWDEQRPDYIVLGDIGDAWDITLINNLFNAMHAGAELIALHKNRFWQTHEGLKADIGFFVAGLEYVCSKNARVMGKPNRAFFQRVLDSVGVDAANALMVGDDLDSDIGGAQQMGVRGCLVKTGKYRDAYLDHSSVKPAYVIASVADLAHMWD